MVHHGILWVTTSFHAPRFPHRSFAFTAKRYTFPCPRNAAGVWRVRAKTTGRRALVERLAAFVYGYGNANGISARREATSLPSVPSCNHPRSSVKDLSDLLVSSLRRLVPGSKVTFGAELKNPRPWVFGSCLHADRRKGRYDLSSRQRMASPARVRPKMPVTQEELPRGRRGRPR